MAVLLVLVLPLAGTAVWRWWSFPREVVYDLYRESRRVEALESIETFTKHSSEHFDVYAQDSDRSTVPYILKTAEEVYGPVVRQIRFKPYDKIPIIVYPSRNALRDAFGWGNNESAIGVYWSGTIRLLSPNVWINEKTEQKRQRVFEKLNPIAHELTHYVFDYYTNGNYPRWFTEGLAQWVEYQTSGYLWLESSSTLRQRLYTLDELTVGFDQLENQPLAYRQSFLLVDYVVAEHGKESLSALIGDLGSGTSFPSAVKRATGTSLENAYDGWLDWVDRNLDELERED